MADNLTQSVKSLQINETNDSLNHAQAKSPENGHVQFSSEELYKLALHFYKGKVKKA